MKKEEYIKACIKDIKTDVYRILGNRGLLKQETRSVEEAIKLTIPKIITLFVDSHHPPQGYRKLTIIKPFSSTLV